MPPNNRQRERFEQIALPHLGAAFSLARSLTRNDEDARDIVQEAYLRALLYFRGFRGENGRVWLLRIVRNTGYTWLKHKRASEFAASFDEVTHPGDIGERSPESLVLEQEDRTSLVAGLRQLRAEWRHALLLRELEGHSYREIASVTDAPIGTVMSRLARAKTKVRELIAKTQQFY